MEKILFVNSCVREESRTYRLAGAVLECLDGDITQLDISEADIKPLDRQSLMNRVELSDKGDFSNEMFKYAHQFAESDTVVIAAPYWDLSFPAVLKAYLEAVSVCGITFKYDEQGVPAGLCSVRKLIYVTTSGGSIGMVLCQKIQAAQNYRKPQQNSCIQRQYPFAGHLLTPF